VTEPRIIVALDVADQAAALTLAGHLDPALCRLKVGMELFTRTGPDVVARLIGQGFGVFLDLKYHDIPNTVAQACRAAADLGVWMVTVHAGGGRAMLETAREALDKADRPPLLIAVTVLTSLGERDLAEMGITRDVATQVLALAQLSRQSGADGIVCAGTEVAAVRAATAPDFRLVTPGIRPASASHDDQRRVMTPVEAIAAGSDYLVIGRPITRAADPAAALRALHEEITGAGD